LQTDHKKEIVDFFQQAESAGRRFYLNVSSRFSSSMAGTRAGLNTGNSLEYLDHREYQPGDDIRHIDWNAMARFDKPTVKLYREEISPHLDLLIDGSASMNLERTAKGRALWGMAALIRSAALNSGYTISLWIIKDRCQKVEPANLPFDKWPNTDLDFCGNTGKTLVTFPATLKRQGVRIFLSDLFWSQEPMTVLQYLTRGAAFLSVVQVLAEFDINPQISGNQRLIDLESRHALEVVADKSLLETYHTNFLRHQEYWKKCCVKTGTVYSMCHAEDFARELLPVELLRNELLLTRS
jgi:hypothetical protein